nr:uncharacterized protein CFP56_41551 [Quercus suber]
MEQTVIDELQNLCLTKEEEDEIPITTQSQEDLLEECSLSLFGRLLSNRQQNIRALKSTLRAAWKMGSELRIVDVGSNVLQFKLKKGLTSANIVFSNSPFWVQLWGLPFELMSEEVGQDIGRSLGRFIEVDKRACLADQAKFMHIRVDLPIEKPLHRGGHVVSKDGEKYWVQFRYKRLPTFCYLCGKLGYDDKHCQAQTDRQSSL